MRARGGQAPPGKRETRPAGDRAGNLEKTLTNGSATGHNPARAAAQALRVREARKLRRARYAQRIWSLGDRVLFELVDHIADRFGIEDEVDRLLDRFANLDPALLRALGADKMPPLPIREVR
jgi:hypothetical protein